VTLIAGNTRWVRIGDDSEAIGVTPLADGWVALSIRDQGGGWQGVELTDLEADKLGKKLKRAAQDVRRWDGPSA
jgi:hypothetical protein